MGKSNRIRSEKAERAATASLKNTKQKKGAPSWLYTLLVSIVAVFVLATIVVSTIVSSGMIMRSQKAIYSENYTINGQMLTYMFNAQYQQFKESNSSNLTYYSLDTSKSLKKQTFGDTSAGYGYETMLLGDFKGTWYDYFMSQVEEQARQLLVYCEEADARGIKLDDEDIAEIDASIAMIEAMAAAYGYTTNSYIAANYGKGVKLKDVRAAMEMSSLAAKCAEAVDEEILANITKDEINTKYNENKKDYNVIDYVAFAITVSYNNIAMEIIDDYDGKTELNADQKAKVLEEYKKRIQTAKDDIDAFKDYKTADEFFDAVLNKVANESFDEYYESEALKDADKLSEDALKAVKEAMIKKVLEEVKTESDSSDDTVEKDGKYTAYEQEVTKTAAKAIDDIKADLYEKISATNSNYNVKKEKYDEEDEFLKWAFEDGRKAGETKLIMDGDGSEEGDITNKEGYFDIVLYMISAEEYCDKTLSKDVAYMTFSTEALAKAAIEAFKSNGKFTKEGFDAVAESKGASSTGLMENYLEGQLTYNGFEDWLYEEGRKVGDYTEKALPNSATSASEFAVFFYVEDGEEAWFIDVQSSIYAEDYEVLYKGLTDKYAVTVKENVLSKVDA